VLPLRPGLPACCRSGRVCLRAAAPAGFACVLLLQPDLPACCRSSRVCLRAAAPAGFTSFTWQTKKPRYRKLHRVLSVFISF
jgi:hypothetical protein